MKVHRIGFSWKGPYIVRDRGTTAKNITILLAAVFVNFTLMVLTWRPWATLGVANLVLGLSNIILPGSGGWQAVGVWRARNRTLDKSPMPLSIEIHSGASPQ